MIAISVLKDVHQRYRDKGIAKTIKCFFVEKNRTHPGKAALCAGEV